MKKQIDILVLEPIAPEGVAMLNARDAFQVDIHLDLAKEDLLQRIKKYHCLIVRSQSKVDRELITAGVNLKLIGRAGVGLDNVDVGWAQEKNIEVINTPSANSISTAELALGLMLTLARKIPFAHRQLQEGRWLRNQFRGSELFDKTLGIIGFGQVGRQLAIRAKAFNMRVIAYDPVVGDEVFDDFGVSRSSLDQLLSGSDFISLHCLLSEQTKNIINRENLSKIKAGANLINTARGELIDDHALIEALDSGRLAHAAIDVFSCEPPPPDHVLLNHPQVVVTPHLGASTKEAQLRVSTILAEQVIGFFK